MPAPTPSVVVTRPNCRVSKNRSLIPPKSWSTKLNHRTPPRRPIKTIRPPIRKTRMAPTKKTQKRVTRNPTINKMQTNKMRTPKRRTNLRILTRTASRANPMGSSPERNPRGIPSPSLVRKAIRNRATPNRTRISPTKTILKKRVTTPKSPKIVTNPATTRSRKTNRKTRLITRTKTPKSRTPASRSPANPNPVNPKAANHSRESRNRGNHSRENHRKVNSLKKDRNNKTSRINRTNRLNRMIRLRKTRTRLPDGMNSSGPSKRWTGPLKS